MLKKKLFFVAARFLRILYKKKPSFHVYLTGLYYGGSSWFDSTLFVPPLEADHVKLFIAYKTIRKLKCGILLFYAAAASHVLISKTFVKLTDTKVFYVVPHLKSFVKGSEAIFR